MRLLDLADSLASVSEPHREGPVRLPFRVDLRDLSLWLQGGNPFAEHLEGHVGGTRSLEGLLARQVTTGSGGASFEVEDLHAVAKVSSLLIVLDGLDEVADIGERTRVVREVTSAVTRLRSIAASLQVVVTSRPAAFANSPAFPTERFQYCHLQSITQPLVIQYAERWIAARGLEPALADDVREVLADKLEEPHMRELARNPMQLAILLSLIHRRGPSLPDKRTALYDSYVHLFFDREAEKTDHVREHRDLLVDIHQYLGWRLQAEAETGKSLGSISSDRLREMLVRYLAHEERGPELVESIFHGLVERVVAIVSRVEGTYEFEVQPLREYFAARYLYDTAPYSPPGAERTGDKTDRFDALARNFYWLNVTRFYAGCYSKGELPSLVDRLELLAESEGFQETTHPRYLATMLLSDWVFAQQPRSMKNVVDLALEDLGVRRAAIGAGEPLTLPAQSGRDELVESCWQLLRTDPRSDRAAEVASTLRANSCDAQLDARFLDAIRSTKGKRRTRFFSHGEWTGSLSRLPLDAVESLLAERSEDRARLSSLMHACRFDVLEASETVTTYVADELLAGRLRAPLTGGPPSSPLEALGQALRIPLAMVDFYSGAGQRWLGAWQELSVPIAEGTASADLAAKCWATAAVLTDQLSRPPTDWTTSLAPWREFIEQFRDLWGDRRIELEFAAASAGIKSRKEKGAVGADLFDPAHNICDRARYARLLAGNSRWWGRQLDAAPRRGEALFVVSLFFAWASAGTLVSQLEMFNDWLANASAAEAEAVFWAVVAGSRMNVSLDRKRLTLDDSALPDVLHPRTVVTLARRAGPTVEAALYLKYLERYDGSDRRVLHFCSRMAWKLVNQDSMPWPTVLEVIRRAYASGAIVTPLRPGYRTGRAQVALPDDVARTVVKHSREYPLEIVAVAESRCRELMNDTIVPVEATARAQGWSWE